jgi:hypothetical protein
VSAARKIDCWHFIRDDRTLAHQSPPLLVEPGFIYGEPAGEIEICRFGMHGSRRVYDALDYAKSSTLCRVRIWGDVQEHADKLVGRYREVLAIRDIASELRLWGCWCIRNTPISGGRTVWDLLADPRSRNSVEVAERFALGEATCEELGAAWAAARDAAGAAAWAAARDAARGAAWDAARGAAWAAARDAAGAAAWDAAGAAAWAAAWDAAIKFQSEELERRMVALFGGAK